jgi:hypothetical protein
MRQKISYRTSRIKNLAQQAISHSKMEAKLNKKEIINMTKESQRHSKRAFKNARTGSIEQVAQAKMEGDNSCIEASVEVRKNYKADL